ncbi:serine hydrolase domain-containing protein [Sphingomonas sp. BIUV-7]|uniref:Serine hydrolase domain-containing protein n=1 Tax=Sphingomonas natans TaxID=3063330 RepID=A0ABT8Y6F3_9SPHN|nr:serine hydrolase domain-containing protein [Sphingomonas sp. BIUV-7]MDO6413899.1 serine hydrolase domain-containing protein [Sphingomonas sp. BIUV-7]
MLGRLLMFCAMLLGAGHAMAAAPDKAALAEVDRIFDTWAIDAHVPGVVYGLVVDGKLVHVRGAGVQDVVSKKPVTPDSLFRIASMSKAFTALAILKLRDEGRIVLDAPAETYVPELKGWHYPTADSPKITVRNLLTHSAGFVEDNPWGDRQQVMPEADFTALLKAGVPFARAPGLGMEYSNLGYATLGRIVSNVSGQRYEEYIRTHLMAPLGMSATGYDIFASPIARRAIGYRWQDNAYLREPDMKDGAFGAMGGVETSATDYAKWVEYLLAAWPARDGADAGPVKRATVREIVTGANFVGAGMRNAAYGGAPCRQASAYGMAWRVLDDCDLGRVVTHTGGYPGYGSVVILLPDKGVGFFAFSSKTYGGASLPAFRALLALNKAGVLEDRTTAVSAGLASAYDSARAVWRTSGIEAAPLANNMLMDRDVARWKTLIEGLKKEVGTCDMDEAVAPVSAMEGKFVWSCEHGRIAGRVQRAPTPDVRLQALEYTVQAP